MKRKFTFFAILVSVLSIILFSACESDKDTKSVTNNEKPITDDNPPVTDDNPPVTDDNSPATDDNPPVTDNDTPVTILSIEQTGGTSGSVESGGLVITFDVDPTTLTSDNITLIGATKGTLSASGTERNLVITNITVENEESVSVIITSPEGYTISGAPMTAVVYNLVIGMDYLGGKLAYIFKAGDLGYVSGETHGIIAAAGDLGTSATWIEEKFLWEEAVTGGTSTAIGSGSSNTQKIIEFVADNSVPKYAALLTREYTGGGYSDWYLPSKDELNILYINKALIGTFSDNYYWSSSEESEEAVWSQNLSSGIQYSDLKKHEFIDSSGSFFLVLHPALLIDLLTLCINQQPAISVRLYWGSSFPRLFLALSWRP